jgi:hypothetical protein
MCTQTTVQDVENYLREATSMLRQCDTPLSKIYFTVDNVNDIQNSLFYLVRQRTGHAIDRQSDVELIQIMRSVYEAFADNVYDPNMEEIRRLDAIVLDIVSSQVQEGTKQYLQYYQDASQMYTPLDRGVNASIKGEKQLVTYNFLSN